MRLRRGSAAIALPPQTNPPAHLRCYGAARKENNDETESELEGAWEGAVGGGETCAARGSRRRACGRVERLLVDDAELEDADDGRVRDRRARHAIITKSTQNEDASGGDTNVPTQANPVTVDTKIK